MASTEHKPRPNARIYIMSDGADWNENLDRNFPDMDLAVDDAKGCAEDFFAGPDGPEEEMTLNFKVTDSVTGEYRDVTYIYPVFPQEE